MRHRDGVVSISGAHVEDDHRRGVLGCSAEYLVLVGAVAPGYERYPGPGLCGHREPGVAVARQAVVRGRGQDHHPLGVPLQRVLPVATALRLLGAELRGGRVHVGDVDEGGVPLLPLGHGEVQAQQVDEAEGQKPRREGQAAAGRHQRARGHDDPPPRERTVRRSEKPDSVNTGDAYSTMLTSRATRRLFNPYFYFISTPAASPSPLFFFSVVLSAAPLRSSAEKQTPVSRLHLQPSPTRKA